MYDYVGAFNFYVEFDVCKQQYYCSLSLNIVVNNGIILQVAALLS